MKKTAVSAFLVFILFATWAQAVEPQETAVNKSSQILLSGEIIAEEISKATGCAISPILGISVLGAYTYYTTPLDERDNVPWHAKPEFWAPLLVVLLGIILKDSSKIALPKIIIMPLDAIETLLEKNASAALGLLVILSSITGKGIEQLQLAGYDLSFSILPSAYAAENMGRAAASSGIAELGILYILVTFVFGLVWVVSQSFNFLIFLCPSSWLDLMLLTLKNSVIALLVGAYMLNPFLGLFVSCVIILICLFLFARSYRFVIFGTIFSSDILFKKSRKHEIESGSIKAFAGSLLDGVPPLSYGSLAKQGSMLAFHYRPWLFMSPETFTTRFRADECEAGIGTLSPVIITTGKKFDTDLTLFRLRPLYDSHEKKVAELLGLKGIRDVAFGKSIRDGYRWLLEQLGIGQQEKQLR